MYGRNETKAALAPRFEGVIERDRMAEESVIRERDPDIFVAIGELEKNVVALASLMDTAEVRLAAVMSSAPIQSPGDPISATKPGACDVSASVRGLSRRVEAEAYRVGQILSRLEV